MANRSDHPKTKTPRTRPATGKRTRKVKSIGMVIPHMGATRTAGNQQTNKQAFPRQ